MGLELDQQIREALEKAAKLGKTEDVAEALKSFPTIKHYQHHSELETHYRHLHDQRRLWDRLQQRSRDVKADSDSLHMALLSSLENRHVGVAQMVWPYFIYLTASHNTRLSCMEDVLIKSSANNHIDVINLVLPHYMDIHHDKAFKEKVLQTILETSSEKGFSHVVESILICFKEPYASQATQLHVIKHALAKSLSNSHHAVVKVILPWFQESDMHILEKIAALHGAIDRCFRHSDEEGYLLLFPIFTDFSITKHREHLAHYEKVREGLEFTQKKIGSGVDPDDPERTASEKRRTFTWQAIHDITHRIETLKQQLDDVRSGDHVHWQQADTIDQSPVDLKTEIDFASGALRDAIQSSRYCHPRALAGLVGLLHGRVQDQHEKEGILKDMLLLASQGCCLSLMKLLVPPYLECFTTAEVQIEHLQSMLLWSKIDGHPDIVALLPIVFPHDSDRVPRSQFLSEALACSAEKGHMKAFVSLLHEFSTSAESYDKWKAGLAESRKKAKGRAAALSESSFSMICQQIDIALHHHLYCKRQILLRHESLKRDDQQHADDLKEPHLLPCADYHPLI